MLEVPSTQNHITFILEFSFPSLITFFDHFLTELIASNLLKNPGSNPTVSMTRNSSISFSYTFNSFVVPALPKLVSAFSSPRTALIKVDLPTPESPITKIFPLSILICSYDCFNLIFYYIFTIDLKSFVIIYQAFLTINILFYKKYFYFYSS